MRKRLLLASTLQPAGTAEPVSTQGNELVRLGDERLLHQQPPSALRKIASSSCCFNSS